MAICPLDPEVNQGLSEVCRKCRALLIKARPKGQPQIVFGVKGIVRVGKQCLVLRKDMSIGSRWDFPGGRINEKELPEQALRREIAEELPSIKSFVIGQTLGNYRFRVGEATYEITFYEVDADPFEVALGDEHTDFRWVMRDDLEELRNTQGVQIEPGFFQAAAKALSN